MYSIFLFVLLIFHKLCFVFHCEYCVFVISHWNWFAVLDVTNPYAFNQSAKCYWYLEIKQCIFLRKNCRNTCNRNQHVAPSWPQCNTLVKFEYLYSLL